MFLCAERCWTMGYSEHVESLAIARSVISSADLCDKFRPRSGPTFPDPNPNCLTLWWYSLFILPKADVEIDDKKHTKLSSKQRVSSTDESLRTTFLFLFGSLSLLHF